MGLKIVNVGLNFIDGNFSIHMVPYAVLFVLLFLLF